MSDKSSSSGSDLFTGWLYKWTNYLKGYQRRWFSLSDGRLSYYRTQAEVAHTCRGTINLAGAYIDTEDSCNFVISSGTQTFHLKAGSEVERQKWVTALELAKAKAIRMTEEFSDDSSEELPPTETEKTDIQHSMRSFSNKLEDLNTCNDLIVKHGAALQRALSDLESVHDSTELPTKIKAITERATLFRITSNAMINACNDYLELAQTQTKKWQRTLVSERDQRIRLEETLELLAKQHNSLERACRSDRGPDSLGTQDRPAGEFSDEDDPEFFDAVEETPADKFTVSLPRTSALKSHRRQGSEHSCNSIGGEARINDEYSSDEDKMPERDEASVISIKGNLDKREEDSTLISGQGLALSKRRATIPERPNHSLNLWSIMKNCIGKELSKIPMPVNFNEPLSMLQRFVEDLEYADILDRAGECKTTAEELAHIAAYTTSMYAATSYRTSKPFNPLLGETYECDRTSDLGWRAFTEQVSHHPPAAAMHAEGKQWELWTDITISSKFRGKYLQIFPQGVTHLRFKNSGSHYTWRKVPLTVHNIIVGKLWVDNAGDCEIVNHTTKEVCRMTFKAYSYFSRDIPRKVTGVVTDIHGTAKYVLSGTWDKKMECAQVLNITIDKSSKDKPVYQTGPSKLLWTRRPLPPGLEKVYYFGELTMTLNEMEDGVAPTDSRRRPDQRLMEQGEWDEANREKLRLEEKQRASRRKREEEAKQHADEGKVYEVYRPKWFKREMDAFSKTMSYKFTNEYWLRKRNQEWTRCANIF
ncbi:oxysterol-binding protein 1-like isoform X1 [Antedon mediterranea]|uniref:oxysterol-binding protein 1-like isoform X1 n=1 Tax=Antedon mediterranea TaxID=105859 RepID=UPI003AF428DC